MSRDEHQESHGHAVLARPVIRTGIITGGSLILVMLVSLFLANRMPSLEPFAWIRNDACRLVFGIIMMIPAGRFLIMPRRLFCSALVGWVIFVIGYAIAGTWFTALYTGIGHTPFQVFMLGIIIYGVIAVLSWVILMLLAASHQPVAPSRHRTHHIPHHR
jgi:hypothetical protein